MPGATYGEEGKMFLRFNVGCSREKVKQGLLGIKIAVESLRNR